MDSFIEILMKPKSLLCGPSISEGNNERNFKPLLYPIIIMNPSLLEREKIIKNYDNILSSVGNDSFHSNSLIKSFNMENIFDS